MAIPAVGINPFFMCLICGADKYAFHTKCPPEGIEIKTRENAMTVHSMESMLEETSEQIVSERAKWLDDVIREAVPEWKLKILSRFDSKFLRKLLCADIEIIHKTLIGNFGMITIVKLNGQLISRRSFN